MEGGKWCSRWFARSMLVPISSMPMFKGKPKIQKIFHFFSVSLIQSGRAPFWLVAHTWLYIYIYIYICICPMRFIYVSVLWDTETYSRDIPFTKAKIHIFSWMSPRCVFSLYVSHSFMMFHGFSGHVRMKNGPIQWRYPHTALRPHT
jgi:hypothetical protein